MAVSDTFEQALDHEDTDGRGSVGVGEQEEKRWGVMPMDRTSQHFFFFFMGRHLFFIFFNSYSFF